MNRGVELDGEMGGKLDKCVQCSLLVAMQCALSPPGRGPSGGGKDLVLS